MKINYIRLLTAVSMAAVFTLSCSKQEGRRYGRAINPVPHVSRTKAAEITSDNISSFRMYAVAGASSKAATEGSRYVNGAIVKKESASWTTYDASGSTPEEYMWINDSPLHFWFYAPIDVEGWNELDITAMSNYDSRDKVSFSFWSTDDTEIQRDLVFAYNGERRVFDDEGVNIVSGSSTNPDYGTERSDVADNTVDVHFYHALSRVNFAISTDDGTFNTEIGIRGIEIVNIADTGECEFTGSEGADGFLWTPGTADATCLMPVSNLSFTGDAPYGGWTERGGGYIRKEDGNHYNLFTTSDYFFLIPQNLAGGKAKIRITFIKDGLNIVKSTDINDEFEAGKYYIYKICAKVLNNSIYFNCIRSVEDWVDSEIPIDL